MNDTASTATTAASEPDRPAVALTTALRADHCPDCGGPVVDAGTGERGCCLCGAWLPTAADRTDTAR